MGSSSAFYSDERGLTEEVVGNISLYHSSSGVHCVQALISHAMGDMVSLQAAATAFVDASGANCQNLDVTLGRCGTLVGCSLLLETMPVNPLLDTAHLIQLGNDVARDVSGELGSLPTIAECYEFPFLGIAHGWAGVLYTTMRWCLASHQEVPTVLRSRLEQLADCGEPHGGGIRWRRKVRREHRKHTNEYMVGWCNGSAGFIYLWTLAHRMFADQRYLTLAERAARYSWEQADTFGNLCCGLAGQAYALLNFYKYTGDREWLVRAWELADRAAVGVFPSDFGRSLYNGQLGVGLLVGELARPQEACMPLFEAERGPNVTVRGS
jgi:eukaryotic-like serine/threonine-protein kinase